MPPKRKATHNMQSAEDSEPRKNSKSSSSGTTGSTSTGANSLSSLTIEHAYRYIEPGPVLLVSTGSLTSGTHNIMTIGFHMMMQHESPPLIGITLGPWNASFQALHEHRECVLAVPSIEIAEKVVDIGNCSSEDSGRATNDGATSNKWAQFGLEPVPAGKVGAPLVGGKHVLANIECVVEDVSFVEKYSMWVLRVVKAWKGEGEGMFHHRGQGVMAGDGEVLDLRERMSKWQEFLE